MDIGYGKAAVIALILLALASPAFAEIDLSLGGQHHRGAIGTESVMSTLDLSSGSLYFNGRYDRAEANGDLSVYKGHARAGYDRALSDHWGVWTFGQAGFNRVRGIDHESFVGSGPKYTFMDGVSLSAGLLHHRQDGERETRLSIRPKVKAGGFSAVVFYQPDVADFRDYIVLAEASYTLALSEHLGLKYSLYDEYRSTQAVKNELTQALMVSVHGGVK